MVCPETPYLPFRLHFRLFVLAVVSPGHLLCWAPVVILARRASCEQLVTHVNDALQGDQCLSDWDPAAFPFTYRSH